ncbi:MAG: nucleotidyltransferase domain-containing protein [Candidatus Humimicrobiaceae bacterium]
MKDLKNLNIREEEKEALHELKEILLKNFPLAKLVLYGSKAREDFDRESDIDILVILKGKVDDSIREKIFSLSYEIELKYDVIFGILVEPEDFWDSPLAESMPIHWSIDKEGIVV